MSTSSSVMKLQHGGANNLISFSTTVVLTVLTVFIKHNKIILSPVLGNRRIFSLNPAANTLSLYLKCG